MAPSLGLADNAICIDLFQVPQLVAQINLLEIKSISGLSLLCKNNGCEYVSILIKCRVRCRSTELRKRIVTVVRIWLIEVLAISAAWSCLKIVEFGEKNSPINQNAIRVQ